MEQILIVYGLPKETDAVIMILYKNTKVKFHSVDGDTVYYDSVTGVLQGDTLAPYLFIICLDYMLRTSQDLMKENGFNKTEYMCFNQRGDISKIKAGPLKLVYKFTYLGSSVSSTENDTNTYLAKAWPAIDSLLVIWMSDLTDKFQRIFFPATVECILLYGCTTWTLTKRMEKKLDSNYSRMVRAFLNKSWRQHPT